MSDYHITRQGDFDRQYNVWAKLGGWPQEAGDGTYVGTFDIEPWESSIVFSWTKPQNGTWYLVAQPLAGDIVGGIARLT